jgi:hypothetical protein
MSCVYCGLKSRITTTVQLVLQTQVQEQDECSVCLELVHSPMINCVNGHGICLQCQKNWSHTHNVAGTEVTCPQCRVSMEQRVKELAMEFITDFLGGNAVEQLRKHRRYLQTVPNVGSQR